MGYVKQIQADVWCRCWSNCVWICVR